jgi:predicted Zn-dependent protease
MNIVVAMLEGFLNDPDQLLRTYSQYSDFQSRYIKAIANYKKGNFSKAIDLIKSLIKENDKDGFIYELYGQILFEGGYTDLAISSYQKAIKVLAKEDSTLSKISLAFAILSKKENSLDELDYIILLLKEAKKIEKENPFLFKNLAVAFIRKDDKARYNLALSEYNYLLGDYKKALKHAKEAKKRLPDSATIEITEADDLIDLLKDKKF